MYDQELVLHILGQIQTAATTITQRFEVVKSVHDFTDSPYGMEKLDSICMQLIAIGESLKNLGKVTNGQLLKEYPDIEWGKAMGLRDIIAHHYFDVNAEAIYDICETRIPELKYVAGRIIEEIGNR
jgi:uncharacterized protein with HEPN domain